MLESLHNACVLGYHPLVNFRITQLDRFKEPEKSKHAFLKSIKENLKGFLQA